MSELRHAREAKRLLAAEFGGDPRITGFGVGTDADGGYTVEGRLAEPVDPPLPDQVSVEIDGETIDVTVRWRVTGPIGPQQ